MTERKKIYIGGEWVEGTAEAVLSSANPATGEILAETKECSESDVYRAIAGAKESFYGTREWRDMDTQRKSDVLLRIAGLIREKEEEIAKIESLDNGKPLREAIADVEDAARCFQYYAGLIKTPQGSIYNVNDNSGPMYSFTQAEPIGVCALITPWNFPFLISAWKLAPALAAGNSVVFKPSSDTVLSAIKLFEIMEQAGLPAGAANLVIGPGSSVGNLLAESPEVDMISFTGSTAVGQGIMRSAAGNLKKVGLELGGKSPNIIFADTDLDAAVEWAMLGAFSNQGEVCCAGSRVIVEEAIKDEFVKRLAARAERMTLGDPLKNPDMGPLISEKHMNKVLGYIESGIREGARLVCGGCRETGDGCANGFFVRPTVFDRCTSEMKIVREEIFGPVITVLSFKTEKDAVEIANDTAYGLAGAVFTGDGARAMRVVREIRAGITWINCYGPTYAEGAWGGYKMSGIGRELGIHGLAEYQEIKQVNMSLTSGTPGWYVN